MRITTWSRRLTLATAVAALAAGAVVPAGADTVPGWATEDGIPVIRVVGTRPVLAAEVHAQLRHYQVPQSDVTLVPPERFDVLDAIAVR